MQALARSIVDDLQAGQPLHRVQVRVRAALSDAQLKTVRERSYDESPYVRPDNQGGKPDTEHNRYMRAANRKSKAKALSLIHI